MEAQEQQRIQYAIHRVQDRFTHAVSQQIFRDGRMVHEIIGANEADTFQAAMAWVRQQPAFR
jgi:hypothetical protein